MEGIEKLETSSRLPAKKAETAPVSNQQPKAPTKGDKAMDMLSQNFGRILDLAGEMIEIRKLKEVTEAQLKLMEENRKQLIDEANAYAIKKRADTDSVVGRMTIIKEMMQDFYVHNNGQMTGEDFCKIITEIVNQMGRIENGLR